MNNMQLANLNKTLKKAFNAVSNDVSKLNKKNTALSEEIMRLHEKSNQKISSDEFYKLVRRMDEDMKELVHKDMIKAAEEKIKQRAEEIVEIPNNNIYKLEKRLDEIKKDLKKSDKDNTTLIKEIKSEFSKTENLKREVKEVSKLKKSLLNQDDKYAAKSKLDNCFEEIDEVYDLIEELEAKTVNSTELDKFKKELTTKLKKFEESIADVEDIEAELTKKIKDIYAVDKKVESIKTEITSIKKQIKAVDNSAEIKKVNIELLKEIGTLDSRIVKQNEVIKDLNNKLNDAIKLFNKASESNGSGFKLRKMYESKLTQEDEEESKKIQAKVKRATKTTSSKAIASKQTASKKNSKSNTVQKSNIKKTENLPIPEHTQKKSIWIKVLDWFTEEVDEEEDEEKK